MQENEISATPDRVMKCRSIRIGSHRVYDLNVFLDPNCISFSAPTVRGPVFGMINVMLESSDIDLVLVHCGRKLPLVFVHASAECGERLRKALGMVEGETPYFDPTSCDDCQGKITFLVDHLTFDHFCFLREVFPGDQRVIEIDHKFANEILIQSLPDSCDVAEANCTQWCKC